MPRCSSATTSSTMCKAPPHVGMTTVQALWFRADDTPGIEADFMAFTPMDVLNAGHGA